MEFLRIGLTREIGNNAFGTGFLESTCAFQQNFFQIPFLAVIIRIPVINQNLFCFQQNAYCLLQCGVLPSAPFFVMAEVQIRMLNTAAFFKQLVAQHVRRLVGLLWFIHQDFPCLPIPAGSATIRDVSKHAL